MPKLNQKGFIAQLLLFLILLAGVGVGIYLVQTKTSLFSKAAPVIPDKPETSFELEAQADTSRAYVDVTPLKSVSVGQKFRVDIWVRSDIDPANLFVAKLKYPADLLKAEIIDSRDSKSFVGNWVERGTFDTNGNISLIGGLVSPGLLTSENSGVVKGVSSMSVKTSTVDGDHVITIGKQVLLQATLTGSAKSGQIWVARLPDGKSEFACPVGIFTNSRGEKWCKIAEGKGPTLSGSFSPKEAGDYIVTANAFTNDTATYTGNPEEECSGNPFSAGPSNNPAWSDCGSGTDFTLITHPGASLEGPRNLKAGEKGYFKATLSGGAKSGQIWVTKGDGKSEFYCPHSSDGKPYKASNGFYWCKIVEWKGSSMEGTYGADEEGSYTAVVNAFMSPEPNGDAPANRCTGTPLSHGFDADKWSDCGPDSRLAVTITPIPQEPPQLPKPIGPPKLLGSRLMATIIFEAKKAGTANIEFTDGSEILRNSDGINILSAKKGLNLVITPAPVSREGVLSLNPSKTTINRGCSFPVNINIDTAGVSADGADAILSYDPTKLIAQTITSGQIFADYPINSIDSATGKIAISAIGSVNRSFIGKGIFATIQFSVKDSASLGSTQVNFNFDPNDESKTTDSNISTVQNGIVTDALGSVINADYTIGNGACTAGSDIGPILSCNAITADAQLGKKSNGDVVYFIESGASAKLTAEFQPADARLEWAVVSKSKNLPTDGASSNPTANTNIYQAPENPGKLVEDIILTASVHKGTKSANCPKINLGVKPLSKQTPENPVTTAEVKNLRHDGDINSDGKVNLVDMSRLLALTGQKGASEADLNSDQMVNVMDVLQLRSILVRNGILGKK